MSQSDNVGVCVASGPLPMPSYGLQISSQLHGGCRSLVVIRSVGKVNSLVYASRAYTTRNFPWYMSYPA